MDEDLFLNIKSFTRSTPESKEKKRNEVVKPKERQSSKLIKIRERARGQSREQQNSRSDGRIRKEGNVKKRRKDVRIFLDSDRKILERELDIHQGEVTHHEDEVTEDEDTHLEKTSDSNWMELGIGERLANQLGQYMGLERPTEVQKAGIPWICKGRDVLLRAQTGSGKTLAYLVPIVQFFHSSPKRVQRTDGCYAVVVAPTRELCQQIYEVLQRLLVAYHWVVPGVVVGGEKKKSEKARLRRGVNVLVTTPGRLLDHLNTTHSFKVDRCRWLVLDEADRLLDMGFESALKAAIHTLDERRAPPPVGPSRRQTVLCSATLHASLQRLADVSTNRPVYVEPGRVAEAKAEVDAIFGGHGAEAELMNHYSVPAALQQSFVEVPCKKRLVALAAFLRLKCGGKAAPRSKILVFFSNIRSVEYHHLLFSMATMQGITDFQRLRDGAPSAARRARSRAKDSAVANTPLIDAPLYKLHGDLSQVERSTIFRLFSDSPCGVLLCTDVAARGLDLPSVSWIVQYDPPGEAAEYVHRVGRTARIGNSGNALLFLMPHERPYADLLRERHSIDMLELGLESLLASMDFDPEAVAAARGGDGDRADRDILLQLFFEDRVEEAHRSREREDSELFRAAISAYHSFVRAYTTHARDTREIFNIKELHLGHVAKSFALRDPPSKLSAEQRREKAREDRSKERGAGRGGRRAVNAPERRSSHVRASRQVGETRDNSGKKRRIYSGRKISEFDSGM